MAIIMLSFLRLCIPVFLFQLSIFITTFSRSLPILTIIQPPSTFVFKIPLAGPFVVHIITKMSIPSLLLFCSISSIRI
ncbi:hypothetical protein PRUPE_6G195200 [Prunus persica]|uniref:Uncharacterized protein n=1 Tax=Prunus persica TaxID=3760 RepID=A0A251NSU6_PRUPE|nr:hypothetical protein PRUPE_6G195200 [Prunus persica]